MTDTPAPPIEMRVERRDGQVDVTLVGRSDEAERYSYILEIAGSSRSRLAATYVGTPSPRTINHTRFPDAAPWHISFRIRGADHRLVHSEEARDR